MNYNYFYSEKKKYFAIKPQDEEKLKVKEDYLRKNDFFEFKKEEFTSRLNADTIINSLANTLQVVFEVTEDCNLLCDYCAFGKFYKGEFKNRKNNKLPLSYAILLLDYLFKLWESDKNLSLNKTMFISFYGGEPLKNVELIRDVVNYCKQNKSKNILFKFSLTTNTILLKRNIDFLIENKFNLLISLDGNRNNNSYRLHKNGKEAFEEIIANIDFVFENYSEYFRTNIQFNAVLHNRNSVQEIFDFIFNKYRKYPRISELDSFGIIESRKEEFLNKFKDSYQSLKQSDKYEFINEQMFIESPEIRRVSDFIHTSTNNVYKSYLDFFNDSTEMSYVPTGTCIPFSRKIYLTSRGQILPCERISYRHAIGNVDENGIHINFDEISRRYNEIFDNLMPLCTNCIYNSSCTQCIFYLDHNVKNIKCPVFSSKFKTEIDFKRSLDFLFKNRTYYKKILNEVHYV